MKPEKLANSSVERTPEQVETHRLIQDAFDASFNRYRANIERSEYEQTDGLFDPSVDCETLHLYAWKGATGGLTLVRNSVERKVIEKIIYQENQTIDIGSLRDVIEVNEANPVVREANTSDPYPTDRSGQLLVALNSSSSLL